MRELLLHVRLKLGDLPEGERTELADDMDLLRDDGTYKGRPVPDPEDPDNEYSDIGGEPDEVLPSLDGYTTEELVDFFADNLNLGDVLVHDDTQQMLFEGSSHYYRIAEAQVVSVREEGRENDHLKAKYGAYVANILAAGPDGIAKELQRLQTKITTAQRLIATGKLQEVFEALHK